MTLNITINSKKDACLLLKLITDSAMNYKNIYCDTKYEEFKNYYNLLVNVSNQIDTELFNKEDFE